MAFSDFSWNDLESRVGIRLDETDDLHAAVAEVIPRSVVAELLKIYQPLATLIGTEKAKSELIVAPLLLEVRELFHRRIGFFSGTDFSVDRTRGLNGICDFILSRSHVQSVLKAPVAVVVEAKDDSIAGGLGQCGAEMVAARIFNEKARNGIETIHGCVTTGTLWRFMTLTGDELTLDRTEYALPDRLAKVLGIFVHAVGGPLVESSRNR